MNRFYCLVVAGLNLSDELRFLLYREACEMFKLNRTESKIRSGMCEGVIKTNFATASLGQLFGTVFHAYIETDQSTGSVSYVIDDRDVAGAEKGIWLDVPEEDMFPASSTVH